MVNRGKKEIEFWVLIIHNFWVGSLLRQTLLNYETNTLDILSKTLVLKFQFSASPLPTHWKKTSSLQSKQPDSVEVLFSLVFTGLVWSMEGECVMTAAAVCCSEVTPHHHHHHRGSRWGHFWWLDLPVPIDFVLLKWDRAFDNSSVANSQKKKAPGRKKMVLDVKRQLNFFAVCFLDLY